MVVTNITGPCRKLVAIRVTVAVAVRIVAPDQVPATWLDATPGSAAWCRCIGAPCGRRCCFSAQVDAVGETAAMSDAGQAQLSVLGAQIDELAQRAALMAEALDAPNTAEACTALFEAERSLVMAGRAVERARRSTVDR